MHPFLSHQIVKVSELDQALTDSWPGFTLDNSLQDGYLRLAEIVKPPVPNLKPETLGLRLDSLSLEHIPPHPLSEIHASIDDKDDKHADDNDDGNDNDAGLNSIWDDAIVFQTTSKTAQLSWSRFENSQLVDQELLYLSETCSTTYDALQLKTWADRSHSVLKFAQPDPFHLALTNLILGKDSTFFQWSEQDDMFVPLFQNFSLPGQNPRTVKTVCDQFCSWGSTYRRLQRFSRSMTVSTSTECALQSSCLQVLRAIESHFINTSVPQVTIPKILRIAREYAELLTVIEQLVDASKTTNTEQETLAKVTKRLDEAWFSLMHLRAMFSQLTVQLLEPAFQKTLNLLKLRTNSGEDEDNDSWLLAKLMPEDLHIFAETIECLKTAHTNLVSQQILQANAVPTLKLVNTWSEIGHLQAQADQLEVELMSSPVEELAQSLPAGAVFDICRHVKTSLFVSPFDADFGLMLRNETGWRVGENRPSELESSVSATLLHDPRLQQPELSPIQALRMSLRPFLHVQHRVTSYSILKSLFIQHDLLAHLETLFSFQLLGDGIFAARLSKALFGADQYSAEGKRKYGLTAGLRLEDREVWPPASSELRLVLMGLLTSTTDKYRQHVLDCMSFAVRDLSDDELELCRDVRSIHTLDFLRLTFTPMVPILELIITPAALEKYDRIFKYLLVLLRTHSLFQSIKTQNLSPSQHSLPNVSHQRLSLEMHHFVETLLDYSLNYAIKLPWQALMKHLKDIRSSLNKNDYKQSIGVVGSVAQLRKNHEDSLEEMLQVLLLRREQADAYQMTCDLLSLSLDFATKFSSHETIPSYFFKRWRHGLSLWLAQIERFSESQDLVLRRLEVLLLQMDLTSYFPSGDK